MRGNLVDFTEIAVHAPSKIDLFASLQRQTGRFDAANRGLRTCKTYSNLLKSVSYPELRLITSDKLLLRKCSIIETIHDQLKTISQIEHSWHRSPVNFLVNLVSGLIVYIHQTFPQSF